MRDYHHLAVSSTANKAGDPLPFIPRRPQPRLIQSSSSSASLSLNGDEPAIPASASIVTITPATPPKTDSDSDTSPHRRGKRRKKTARVPNPTALYPPELSTPVPVLRTPLIRKKSGQVLRPSLKSSSSYSTSSPITTTHLFPSSKSEPVTPLVVSSPSSKAVHFDKNLAQVKLFLTAQKPLAVSREGSPGDTDEDETTGPSGAENNEISRFFGLLSPPPGRLNVKPASKLLMRTNMPAFRSAPFLSSTAGDVSLESLLLADGDKNILGTVLVRNIAFDKAVTARFSFDGWCTTSEVSAAWKEGIGAVIGGRTEWDRFKFTIWLGDLALDEDKGSSRRLELAVRYRVPNKGHEVWDNNGGRNYVATFDRTAPIAEAHDRGREATQFRKKAPLPAPFSDDELSDLLEKAAAAKTTARKSRSISPTAPRPAWPPLMPPLGRSDPRTPCKPGGMHARTRSFPFSGYSSPQSVRSPSPLPASPPVPAWVTKQGVFDYQNEETAPIGAMLPDTPTSLGSPRDLGEDAFHASIRFPTVLDSDSDEGADASERCGTMRRHRRGGYFDKELGSEASPTSVLYTAENTTLLSTRQVKDLPSPGVCIASQTSVSLEGESKTSTPSALDANLASDETSDSSSTSTLLENESPPSSRSSSPSLEEPESATEARLDRTSEDRELYKDFLNR